MCIRDRDKLVSLAEYASRMKEDQKYIYYACGETIDKIKLLPVMETLSDNCLLYTSRCV